MSTRAVKRKRQEELASLAAPPEMAPSVLRPEQPTIARSVGIFALFALACGALAFFLLARGYRPLLGPGGALLCVAVGVAGLLFHAAVETDLQWRRLYGVLGAALLAAGVFFRLFPAGETIGGLFLPAGVPCLGLALAFLLAFARHETDPFLRTLLRRGLGLATLLLILTGALGGLIRDSFLLTEGAVLLLLGLLYAAAYLRVQPPGSPLGYWAGLALGTLGGVMMLLALGWWLLPGVFGFFGWTAGQPAAPFLYFYAGLEYVLLAVLACSDARLAVMVRKELGSYFYSPIAYVVLAAVILLGAYQMLLFLSDLNLAIRLEGGLPEPIVLYFIFALVPVVAVICVVPIVTMRLLSEEQRVGTLEMLLTAPVDEWAVVLSKFLAGLRFFLLVWYPWGVYLLALRIVLGQEFDYRPLLSFALALLFTGAHFVALGLFFSSLTRNQIAAAILTFMSLIFMLLIYFFHRSMTEGTAWHTVLSHVSFLNLWYESLRGNVIPRLYVFQLSAAFFWLFITVRVLQLRRWL